MMSFLEQTELTTDKHDFSFSWEGEDSNTYFLHKETNNSILSEYPMSNNCIFELTGILCLVNSVFPKSLPTINRLSMADLYSH